MWNYDFTIEPGQIRTIWLINGTYTAPATSSLSVVDDGVFPPANSPTPTSSVTPTNTPTPSITPTQTPTPSVTPTLTSTPTPSVTPTLTSTQTPTPTTSVTPTLTSTQTPTPTTSVTPTLTSTQTPTTTTSVTPTLTSTQTPTPTTSVTPTLTSTPTPTPSSTQPIQGLFFTLQEVGPDVVLSGSGAVNLSSLSSGGFTTRLITIIDPLNGEYNVGDVGGAVEFFSGVTLSPYPSLGSGTGANADLTHGDLFGVTNFGLMVPYPYTGGLLDGTATFTSTTLSTLGVTVPGGPYQIQWGASGVSETITFEVI